MPPWANFTNSASQPETWFFGVANMFLASEFSTAAGIVRRGTIRTALVPTGEELVTARRGAIFDKFVLSRPRQLFAAVSARAEPIPMIGSIRAFINANRCASTV